MRSVVRSLCRRPIYSLAAILTVAVAIGANTALFGVIYAVLIQPLPFRDPGKLVQIWETHPALPQLQVAVPDFEDWRSRTHSFDQIAAHTLSAMNTATLLGQGSPEIVHATMASSNLFPLMGIEPLVGRVFTYEEERTKQPMALMSENLWRRKFGGDPGTLGRQVRLGSDSFRIVGIVPQRQTFPEWADLWIPLSLIEPDLKDRRKYHPLEVIARLKSGVTPEQSQIEVQTIARQLAETFPDTNATVGAYVIPLARELTRGVRPSLLLAWGAVGLVLLMACANLAHLFMARMLQRSHEMRIREALGARASHLISQVMMQGLLIALIGGGVGIGLGARASQFVRRLDPRVEWTTLNAPVLLFAFAIAMVCGILFGLPACWQVMRRRRALAGSGRSVIQARSRLSSVLMAAEVAMALLVLAGAALLTRTFAALLSEDPGFRAERVLVIPDLPLRNDWTKASEFLATQIIPAIRAVPGAQDVAAVNSAPMSLGPAEHSRFATRFGIEGRTFDSGSYPVAQNRWITPEFFQTLGIPLKRGRLLNNSDVKTTRIVINETLARLFFPDQDPVGKRLILGVMDPKRELDEIVGVVGDVRDLGLDQEVEPTLYGPGAGPSMTLLVKTQANPQQFMPAIRKAIQRVDPDIPVGKIQPLEQNVSTSLARRRFVLDLLGVFAGLAAFLTAAGVYGLLAYSVNARTREFGLRAAVGASSGKLVTMILREAAVLVVPGLMVGLILSLGFGRVMKSFVYKVCPFDPVSIAAAGLFIVGSAFLSAWIPARRAASVDPAVALRTE